jgi:hypothetical protein
MKTVRNKNLKALKMERFIFTAGRGGGVGVGGRVQTAVESEKILKTQLNRPRSVWLV